MELKYGISSKKEIKKITEDLLMVIEDKIRPEALSLVLETIAAETLMGDYIDTTPDSLGVGLAQIDKGTFESVKDLTAEHIKEKIESRTGIIIDKLDYSDIAYAPVLQILFCRLKYLRIPAPIPKTLEERAKYWKKFYNTIKGKGTIEQYIQKSSLVDNTEIANTETKGIFMSEENFKKMFIKQLKKYNFIPKRKE